METVHVSQIEIEKRSEQKQRHAQDLFKTGFQPLSQEIRKIKNVFCLLNFGNHQEIKNIHN